MKIGIYNPYLDDLGGGEKYMMQIAECLSQTNDISVFWDKKADVDEFLKRFSINLSKVRFVKNIFSPTVTFLERILATKNYDVIIVLSDGSIPFSLSKKILIHLQQPIYISKLSLKEKFKISRINKFFCNSYYSKSYVDKSLGIKAMVLYPPVPIKKRNLKKENIILHVGRFRVRDVTSSGQPIGDYKKQEVMIHAFKEMFKKGLRNWRLVIAVSVLNKDIEDFSKMREEAKGFPVDFLINKSNDELWDIYSRAKIYWHATGFGEDLNQHPEYAEHFGISTVEAMGAGAVPVVINAGGQKEIVQNAVNGFLWNTIEELNEFTQKLILDEKLLERMSKKAEERAKLFEADKFCKKVVELINE